MQTSRWYWARLGFEFLPHYRTAVARWGRAVNAALGAPLDVSSLSEARQWALVGATHADQPFLDRKFPIVSIIRPTQTDGAATGTVRAFTNDGLFIGQSAEFFAVIAGLAQAADAARHGS